MSANQKIVVISADADAGVKSICKSLGVLAYFTKPPKPENFKEVILAILEGKETLPPVEDSL